MNSNSRKFLLLMIKILLMKLKIYLYFICTIFRYLLFLSKTVNQIIVKNLEKENPNVFVAKLQEKLELKLRFLLQRI